MYVCTVPGYPVGTMYKATFYYLLSTTVWHFYQLPATRLPDYQTTRLPDYGYQLPVPQRHTLLLCTRAPCTTPAYTPACHCFYFYYEYIALFNFSSNSGNEPIGLITGLCRWHMVMASVFDNLPACMTYEIEAVPAL